MKFERTPYGGYMAYDGTGAIYSVQRCHNLKSRWEADRCTPCRKLDRTVTGCRTKREAVAICEIWNQAENGGKP